LNPFIYRLRDPKFAPFITARILGEYHYPYKGLTYFEVEITDSRKPVGIQTSITPIWGGKHFREVFEIDGLA
jgi:hypothetical protein